MAEDKIAYRFVMFGGSAGSLEVLLEVVPKLKFPTEAVFLFVLHRKNDADSILPNILSARTKIRVHEIEDKDVIEPGTIYVAPSDYHVLFESPDMFSLDTSEKVHHSRPSIDVSFESLAEAYGDKAIGVLLSGANADGANGLKCLKQRGGLTIVQDPATADVAFMPQQAVNGNFVDHILKPGEMAEMINRLT